MRPDATAIGSKPLGSWLTGVGAYEPIEGDLFCLEDAERAAEWFRAKIQELAARQDED
jgi:hypothetical protein